ncbi:MAG: zinc-dependent alcohol dehydrogenase family protein [Bdellovibrionales bacterium]
MIAVLYDRPGEPADVLYSKNLADPAPQAAEVVVKMSHMSIVPADMATIRGLYRTPQKTPTVPGYGGQGQIVAVGPGVTSFSIGDTVLIMPFKKPGWTNGCWQELVCVDESDVVLLPKDINLLHTPDFFNTPLTAWVMTVEILNLGPQHTLLLTAAGSCVGRMVLGLASVRGYKVIAVVRRPQQVEEIRQLGATHVICSSNEDIGKSVMSFTQLKGVDAVIDAVGGEITGQCFKLLSDAGKMIVYGLLDLQRQSSIDIRKMLFYNLSVQGFWLPGWWFNAPIKLRTQAMNKAMQMVQKGVMVTPIEKEYPLTSIKEAVRHAEKSGNVGRVMLVPG